MELSITHFDPPHVRDVIEHIDRAAAQGSTE
jgi:hypothetical protein